MKLRCNEGLRVGFIAADNFPASQKARQSAY